VKIQKGPELCSDGKPPSCKGGTKATTCKDGSTPAGKPPLCKDSTIPACADFLPPTTCTDGGKAVAKERVQIKTVDAKGRETLKTIVDGVSTEVKKGPELCADNKPPSCAGGAKPTECKDKSKPEGFPPLCGDGNEPLCAGNAAVKCQDGSTAKAAKKVVVQDSKTGVVTVTEERDGKTIKEVMGQKKCSGGVLPACSDAKPPGTCGDKSIPEGSPPVCNDGKKAYCADKLPPKCADGTSGVAKVEKSVTDTKTGEVTKTITEGAKVTVDSTRKLTLCPDGEVPACGDNSTARTCLDKSVAKGDPLICKDGKQPVCAAGNKAPTKCAGAATPKAVVVKSQVTQDAAAGTTTVTTTKGDVKETRTIKKEGKATCADGSAPTCLDKLPVKDGLCGDKSLPTVCADKSAPVAKAVVTTVREDTKTGKKTEDVQKVEAAITDDGEVAVVKAVKAASGEVGFRCEKVGEAARVSCGAGYCCGEGRAPTAAGAEPDPTAPVVETCQKTGATAYVHRPAVGPPEQWDFKCIEGAKSLAISACALLGAAMMME